MWIDFQKAYELLKRSMQSWRTVLFSGKNKLGKVNIRWGIFQGYSLSPLLFVVALIPVTIILRTLKQGYSFGKGKERLNHLLFMDDLKLYSSNNNEIDSLVKVIKIVSQVHYVGVDLGDGEVIEEANEEGCNNLGVLEMDDICQEKVKEKVQKEYYKRVKAVLKSKLKCGNVVNAINIWVVATVWYGTGIINWIKRELVKIDQQMKNLLNM